MRLLEEGSWEMDWLRHHRLDLLDGRIVVADHLYLGAQLAHADDGVGLRRAGQLGLGTEQGAGQRSGSAGRGQGGHGAATPGPQRQILLILIIIITCALNKPYAKPLARYALNRGMRL